MKLPIGTTGRAGEICPETGIWKVGAVPTTTHRYEKGSRFHSFGKGVEWRLISYE
jgi:hypothetical protein